MEDGFNYQTAIEEFQDERPVWKQIWAAIITEYAYRLNAAEHKILC